MVRTAAGSRRPRISSTAAALVGAGTGSQLLGCPTYTTGSIGPRVTTRAPGPGAFRRAWTNARLSKWGRFASTRTTSKGFLTRVLYVALDDADTCTVHR